MGLISMLLLSAAALSAADPFLSPLPSLSVAPHPLTITRTAVPVRPFTVAGEHGAILGEQSGAFEAWIFPVKVLSHFRITAELADYPVPIDLSEHEAVVEATPAMTTITYSHAAFTVKQRMFAPRDDPAGVVVYFEIDSLRPLRLTFRFQPDVVRMWPAPNFGPPDAEWVRTGNSGYYVLHTNDPKLAAVVAMPRATPGILPPYQERPKTYPLELKLSFDPKTDTGLVFPLLITLGDGADLAAFEQRIPKRWSATEDYYAHFFDHRLTVESPDPEFNRALRWAEIAIDHCRVKFHDETGLVAGFYQSGDSARPGFGWFFGRDTLWTLYAVNSYGDPALARTALEFLIRRQRADGKIMHEFSQTADLVDWRATPYFYAAADASPLFVMAMEDYVNATGDLAFLTYHWDAVRRAYAFTRAHDSDGDGIYENTEGTGWVESWPPTMPHQEIYLAALDQQSADAMSHLAALMHDPALAGSAHKQAARIAEAIEHEYFDQADRFYAFSRNADGSLDRTATMYPAVAWWTGRFALAQPGPMLTRWASHEFSTGWGTRDVSDRTPFYDPISYHQGSVWPLFTGWVALAEYRAGRPLAGYAHLMQNAGLTWAQDLGAVTELLSGAFFQPMGRSSSHQMWSSAMVLIPALRGLFGIDADAPHRTLHIAPHLPADWDEARVRNVPLGDARIDLEYKRSGDELIVRTTSADVCLAKPGANCTGNNRELRFPLPPVEVSVPHALPLTGTPAGGFAVLDERLSGPQFVLELEGRGGAAVELPVRQNRAGLRVEGAELANSVLRVRFPEGPGFTRCTVTIAW